MYDTPRSRGTEAMTSSASAIAGTALGLTKEVASSLLTPAAARRVISSTLVSVPSRVASFWSPSRGETSMISAVSVTGAPVRWLLADTVVLSPDEGAAWTSQS